MQYISCLTTWLHEAKYNILQGGSIKRHCILYNSCFLPLILGISPALLAVSMEFSMYINFMRKDLLALEIHTIHMYILFITYVLFVHCTMEIHSPLITKTVVAHAFEYYHKTTYI